MPIIRYEEEPTMPCPQCNAPLEMKPEKEGFVLRCDRHGHEARGCDPNQTIRHWNIYIAFIVRQAAQDAIRNRHSPIEHSYCCFCERQTKSIVGVSEIGDYEVECGSCHLKKYRKEATRANRLYE